MKNDGFSFPIFNYELVIRFSGDIVLTIPIEDLGLLKQCILYSTPYCVDALRKQLEDKKNENSI